MSGSVAAPPAPTDAQLQEGLAGQHLRLNFAEEFVQMVGDVMDHPPYSSDILQAGWVACGDSIVRRTLESRNDAGRQIESINKELARRKVSGRLENALRGKAPEETEVWEAPPEDQPS